MERGLLRMEGSLGARKEQTRATCCWDICLDCEVPGHATCCEVSPLVDDMLPQKFVRNIMRQLASDIPSCEFITLAERGISIYSDLPHPLSLSFSLFYHYAAVRTRLLYQLERNDDLRTPGKTRAIIRKFHASLLVNSVVNMSNWRVWCRAVFGNDFRDENRRPRENSFRGSSFEKIYARSRQFRILLTIDDTICFVIYRARGISARSRFNPRVASFIYMLRLILFCIWHSLLIHFRIV